jgi:hypothetical protein
MWRLVAKGAIFVLGYVGRWGVEQIRTQPAQTNPLEFPQLTCDRPKAEKLVVFLHGWRGDAQDTWRRFPQLVCNGPAFIDADVLSIGYPTHILNSNLTVSQLSTWIAERLVKNDFGKYKRVAIRGA